MDKNVQRGSHVMISMLVGTMLNVKMSQMIQENVLVIKDSALSQTTIVTVCNNLCLFPVIITL